jgi:NAD(P)H-hydrate epimerase
MRKRNSVASLRGGGKPITIPIYEGEVPSLTIEQMIEVDRAMMQDMRIELIQMMENAGRHLAHLARVRFFNGNSRGKKVVVLAGTGGGGGGALVCARKLHTWGAHVQVVVTHPSANFTPVPAHQLESLQRMNVSVAGADALAQIHSPELIVDGLIGYRLKGAPHGTVADLIRWANAQAAPILALDIPSEVDGTSGAVFDPSSRATATMTLALPKAGLFAPEAQAQVGELYLADIGVPPSLYGEPALSLHVGALFAEGEILRLDPSHNELR